MVVCVLQSDSMIKYAVFDYYKEGMYDHYVLRGYVLAENKKEAISKALKEARKSGGHYKIGVIPDIALTQMSFVKT